MKTKFYILGLIILFFISSYSQNKILDTIYVCIEEKSELLNFRMSTDSLHSTFNILKERFNTKKKRKEFLKKYEEFKVPHASFYINFVSNDKPLLRILSDIEIYSVADISKNNIRIGHRTKIYFLDKIKENKYLVYKTFMIFEE